MAAQLFTVCTPFAACEVKEDRGHNRYVCVLVNYTYVTKTWLPGSLLRPWAGADVTYDVETLWAHSSAVCLTSRRASLTFGRAHFWVWCPVAKWTVLIKTSLATDHRVWLGPEIPRGGNHMFGGSWFSLWHALAVHRNTDLREMWCCLQFLVTLKKKKQKKKHS